MRAACVLGSVARREPDAFSDVDVLVIIDPGRGPASRPLRADVPRRIRGHRVQIRIMTASRLAELRDSRTMFAAHVAFEGEPVFDRKRDLRRLRRAFPPGSTVEESGEALRRRLALYDELDWCHGHYLACLADVYAFGRAGVMLALARRGVFDFGRSTPFERFAEASPLHAEAAATVRRLEPFYLRDRRGVELPVPFPHRDSHEQTAQARDACQRLLTTVP